MQLLWRILGLLLFFQQILGAQGSLKIAKKIDTDVVLPVLFKELDHIQAIIGRYDTFFFLMKQICLGSVLALIGVYLNKAFPYIKFTPIVPGLFWTYEYSFRSSYWSPYVIRVIEIKKILNGQAEAKPLYLLRSRQRNSFKEACAVKRYDLFFYGTLAAVLEIFAVVFGKTSCS